MGDRVNIIVADVSTLEGIAIYSHWGGSRMADSVARFLTNAERFDTDYFTRNLLMNVIADGLRDDNGAKGFDMVPTLKEDELREFVLAFQDQLSYGVSLNLAGDREYPIIVLDPSEQKVYLVDDYKVITIKEAIARCYESKTFDEFKSVKTWTEARELWS
jgi:hypothetical protein